MGKILKRSPTPTQQGLPTLGPPFPIPSNQAILALKRIIQNNKPSFWKSNSWKGITKPGFNPLLGQIKFPQITLKILFQSCQSSFSQLFLALLSCLSNIEPCPLREQIPMKGCPKRL